MKIKKIVGGVAAVGLAAGMLTAGASRADAFSGNIHPYLDLNFGLVPGTVVDVVALGSTNPGTAGSEICLMFAQDSSGNNISNTTTAGAYNSKINGVFVAQGSPLKLDVDYTLSDLNTAVSSCTKTNVGFNDTGTASVSDAVKHKGTVSVVTQSSTTPGIYATSISYMKVVRDADVAVATPAGWTLLSSTGTTTKTEVFAGPATPTASKANRDLTACEDSDRAIDLNSIDGVDFNTDLPKPTGSPETVAIDTIDTTSYNEADYNFGTFKSCAQSQTQTPGKAGKVKFAFSSTAAGTASVSFLYAATIAPHVWDDTLGKCKVIDDPTRLLDCKGGYGRGINFALAVRGVGPDGVAAANDPNGLLQHGVTIPLGTVNI